MKQRLKDIDFIKGILIILMVLFHLNHFFSKYPDLTKWIYTFHMPIFLIFSGYFFNFRKNFHDLWISFRSILYPFLLFESIYYVGLASLGGIMGASNSTDLSLMSYLSTIFVDPIGTYWFLHTILICMAMFYLVYKIIKDFLPTIIISSSLLYLLANIISGLSWYNCLFFIIGIYIKDVCGDIKQIIRPTLFAIIPIILIGFSKYDNIFGRISNSIMIISFLLALYGIIGKYTFTNILSFVGKNSLSIVVISPFLTILTKPTVKYFMFDDSAIIWAFLSTIFVVTISIFIAFLINKICPKILSYKKY